MAYLWLPFLGFLWTAVAVIVANARQKGISVFHFYMSGSLFSFLIFLGLNLFLGLDDILSPAKRQAVLIFMLGSLLNGLGQSLVMYNMKKGGRALAFAIPQLAFILPYTWSILFWGEKFSLAGGTGLICITAAICFLAMKKSDTAAGNVSSSLDFKRILLSFAAMLIIGSGHIGMSLPTQLPPENRLPVLNGAMVMVGTATLFFLIAALLTRMDFAAEVKKSWKYSLAWGIGAVVSNGVMLYTLELMGRYNKAGIVFPISCCTLIMMFTIYAAWRFRERLSVSQVAAFAAIIAGSGKNLRQLPAAGAAILKNPVVKSFSKHPGRELGIFTEFQRDRSRIHPLDLHPAVAVGIGERGSIPVGVTAFGKTESDSAAGKLFHHIAAPVAAEAENICAAAAMQRVISGAASDNICAGAAHDTVIAAVTENGAAALI